MSLPKKQPWRAIVIIGYVPVVFFTLLYHVIVNWKAVRNEHRLQIERLNKAFNEVSPNN